MDAPSKAVEIKAAITAGIAAVTAIVGWRGVLIVVWVFSMVLDYITGSIAAIVNGEWSSKVARQGIWHKTGAIAVMLVAAMLDVAVYAIGQMGVLGLTWNYESIVMPVVAAWLTLTELGSNLENAVRMGAPCPKWLAKIINRLLAKIDDKGENIGVQSGQPPDDTGWEIEHSASEDLDSGEK